MNEILNIAILFVLITFIVIVSAAVLGVWYAIPSGNVAMIHIDGDIVSTGGLLSGEVTSDYVISKIKEAESNPNVQAIVLSINSPGGMVVASKEIAEYVKNTSIPVVAWIREVGASGAYLISSASDYIVCDNLSITGSIGVTDSYLEFSETLQQYGVEYVRIVSGEHKDIGSSYRNLTADEQEILLRLVNESFDYFLNFVIEHRNLTEISIESVRDGRIMGGSEAYELGLVDNLGGLTEVESYLASLGIEDIVIDDYSSSYSLLPELSGLLGFRTDLNLPSFN